MRFRNAGGLVVTLVVGVGCLQPLLAAGELSSDELRMKERVIALSREDGSLADLRIELMDGGAMTGERMAVYDIAGGTIVSQEWDAPGSPEQRQERAVTDEAVRALLRALVETQYWTFQGTQFIPDADSFLVRIHDKGLQPVEYRCDAQEYASSPQRSAIRSVLLTFVSGASPAAPPVTP